VSVVQSPWAGLFVPNATVLPAAGTEVEVEVEVEWKGRCLLAARTARHERQRGHQLGQRPQP